MLFSRAPLYLLVKRKQPLLRVFFYDSLPQLYFLRVYGRGCTLTRVLGMGCTLACVHLTIISLRYVTDNYGFTDLPPLSLSVVLFSIFTLRHTSYSLPQRTETAVRLLLDIHQGTLDWLT